MSDTVIRVENLSKLYLLGKAEQKRESLLAEVGSLLSAPFRNFRELRRLDTSTAAAQGKADSDDILWALRDVSFDVKQGEVLGIIGRNGAGKSTLLKILSRITEPTSGRVRIKGRVASLLEVGTGFHQDLTGRENVYLNGTILGMTRKEIDRKFDEIVDFSGVERFLDTPVKRYSSGMKVRLGFAVAAHLMPDVLIVDEVLSVGDADFQRKCIDKMRDVAKGGDRTVLLVSHNMASIASLATHCLHLKDGQTVAYGGTDDVIDEYMKQFGTGTGSTEPGLFVPPAREDGKPTMLKSLEIFSRGRRTNRLVMGDDLSFRITLDGAARPDIASGLIGIAIETTSGIRVLSLGSVHAGFRFSSNGDIVHVMCDTKRLPLNQGQYLIRVVLAEASSTPIENYEALGRLDVAPADVFGAGPMLSQQQGFFHWKAQWMTEEPVQVAARTGVVEANK